MLFFNRPPGRQEAGTVNMVLHDICHQPGKLLKHTSLPPLAPPKLREGEAGEGDEGGGQSRKEAKTFPIAIT
ncbi:MAG: hypothetical protein ACOYXB_01520 [Bacteroidota bacterium]